MRVTAYTQRLLRFRREERRMRAGGYEYLEPWSLDRGAQMGGRIVDVQIAANGRRIYYRVAVPPKLGACPSSASSPPPSHAPAGNGPPTTTT